MNNVLTPCSGVLLGKLTGPQAVKKFPAFYATRRVIIEFTSAYHCPYPSSSFGAELPLVVERFGLLNYLFPYPSILDAGYPVFILHLANICPYPKVDKSSPCTTIPHLEDPF